MEAYLVPARFGEAEFTEKKSRFLGRVWYVSTEAEALARIGQMRARHADATHNCWAYRLRSGAVRFSDDGEPGGTAGMPIVQVLQKEDLFDAVCVVTRYFGGILLGSGGLVRAYTRAAKMAVDAAGKARLGVWTRLRVPCPYGYYERVRQLCAERGGTVADAAFGAAVELTLLLPEAETAAFSRQLAELTAGTVEAAALGQEYRAMGGI